MKLSHSRASLMRAAGATVVATATLAAGLPGIAHAAPADPGDRTVSVTVKNHTSVRLNLDEADVTEGDWTLDPPGSIKAFKVVHFGSVSTDFEGGTEANVSFRTKFGMVELYWSDPWEIDNDFTCDTPPELSCQIDSDLGPNARATFDLFEN
ncbi:hypothetical protein [Actinoplanes sp. NPDC026623]|uniref:hypothetical protein n=1 Tax=Actinoplanes sp. NPDC026623 TaxID=3155610 RepID=UPI0033FA0547